MTPKEKNQLLELKGSGLSIKRLTRFKKFICILHWKPVEKKHIGMICQRNIVTYIVQLNKNTMIMIF